MGLVGHGHHHLAPPREPICDLAPPPRVQGGERVVVSPPAGLTNGAQVQIAPAVDRKAGGGVAGQ